MSKYDDDVPIARYVIIGGAIAGFLLLVFAALGAFFVVDPGEQSLIVDIRDGVHHETYSPGTYGKTPFFQREVSFDVRQQLKCYDLDAGSLDQQDVFIRICVRFQLSDVAWLYQNLGAQSTEDVISKVIDPGLPQDAKAVTAKYPQLDITLKREEIRNQIEAKVRERLLSVRTNLIDVAITNVHFDPAVEEAIKQTAEAAQNAKKKEYEVQVAKAEADRVVAQAEGTRLVAQKNADADYYTKIKAAEAQAQGIRLISQNLTTSPQYLDLQRILYPYGQTWNGQLPLYNGAAGYTYLPPPKPS